MRKGLGGLRKIVNSAILKKFGRRAHFFICVEIQATPLMNPSFQRTLLVTVAGILLVLAGWTGHEIHVLSAQLSFLISFSLWYEIMLRKQWPS
jgi:hypothetical protein